MPTSVGFIESNSRMNCSLNEYRVGQIRVTGASDSLTMRVNSLNLNRIPRLHGSVAKISIESASVIAFLAPSEIISRLMSKSVILILELLLDNT